MVLQDQLVCIEDDDDYEQQGEDYEEFVVGYFLFCGVDCGEEDEEEDVVDIVYDCGQ